MTRQPDVREFQRSNPDWYLHCAVLENPPGNREPYHDWRWWFNITDGEDATGAWVTKFDGAVTETDAIPNGTWARERSEVAGACGGTNPGAFYREPQGYAPVEDFHDAFRGLLPADRWSEDAVWTRLEIDPEGVDVLLSRCRAQDRTFCSEITPALRMGPEGHAYDLLAPAPWVSAPYRATLP